MKKDTATPVSTKSISAYEKKITTALQTAYDSKVAKFEDVMEAADFLFEVKTFAEKVETEKKTIIQPFKTGIAAIGKMFKRTEDNYAEAEKVVKDKVLAWHQSEWEAGRAPDNKISGLNGSVTVIERIRVSVEDATKIPREFCMPDPEKIEHALKAGIKVEGASLVPSYTINSGKN